MCALPCKELLLLLENTYGKRDRSPSLQKHSVCTVQEANLEENLSFNPQIRNLAVREAHPISCLGGVADVLAAPAAEHISQGQSSLRLCVGGSSCDGFGVCRFQTSC